MFDLIALTITGGLAYLGWRRRTLLTALSGLGLVAGYVAAIFFYRQIGVAISETFGLPVIFAYPLGGMFALMATNMVVSLIARRIRARQIARREDGFHPTVFDRAGGAAIGWAWGGAIVVLVAWGGSVLYGFTGRGLDVGASVSGRLSAAMVERAVRSVARDATGDDFLASVVALAAVDPGRAAGLINTLKNDTLFQSLFREGELREAIASSDVSRVARHPTIQSLLSDESFVAAASQLRLIDRFEAGAPTAVAVEQLTERIGPLVRTVERLSNDSDFQRMLEESDIIERFQNGDVIDLMRDPDFERFFSRSREIMDNH